MMGKFSSFSPGSTVSSALPGYIALCLTLQVHRLASAQFTVTGPDQPITVSLGGEAILPCHVFPRMSAENMELRWFRSQFSAVVHRYKDGQDQYGEQMPEYQGRTELLKDNITSGSVSLRIRDVQLSDHGQYTCFFQSSVLYEEALMELQVAVSGSDPHISVDGHQDGGIRVVCRSAGWHPEPEAQWRDRRGQLLPSATEKISKDANDLFHSQISIVITEHSNQNLSCSVRNPLLNQEKISTVSIAELFFPRVNPWLVTLGVILALQAVLIALASYCVWRQHRAKDKLQAELRWKRAQIYAGTVHTTDVLSMARPHLPLGALCSFPCTKHFPIKFNRLETAMSLGVHGKGQTKPRLIAEQGPAPFGKGLISDEMLPPGVTFARGTWALQDGHSYLAIIELNCQALSSQQQDQTRL
ncbi:butyrophilin subfamily 3 member A2-like [Trachemys scripta elegans]|uniref:butyrophilin subfamily 3 member A2-like n=1 Tax=Trachemys scripta elegans TaxID=31138 RepID=UPI0015578256|nr:butyrophilin subfamily 3 member A2-like [Trachemys scripta elegans]